MLGILVSWLICVGIFFAFGRLFVNICNGVFKKEDSYGFVSTFFLGICFVGTFLSTLSIWMPINTTTGWGFFFIALLYLIFLYFRKDKLLFSISDKITRLSLSVKIMIALVFVTILYCSLLPPFLTDMRLYYLQTIMWNESYPIIPGLGNVHGRFGFNSNILLLSSAFSFYDIFPVRIYGILGLSIGILISWLIVKTESLNNILGKIAVYFLCFMFFRVYEAFLSSPSTDILPNVLVVFILMKAIFDKQSMKNNPLIYTILPVYAITLKLSVVPICLFFIYVVMQLLKSKQYKPIMIIVVVSIITVLPWLARNIIITGYLIYPFPAIDLFSFDWKIPMAAVVEEKTLVSLWAKMPGLSIDDFNKMPFIEWFKVWLLRYLRYSKSFTFIFSLIMLSPLFVGILYLKKKIKSVETILPWIVAVCGFIFWFILAPDVRFGISFILISAISPFLLQNWNFKLNKILNILPSVAFAISLLFIMVSALEFHDKYRRDKTITSYLLTPQSFKVFDDIDGVTFESYKVGTVEMYYPSNFLCSDHALPCTPFRNDDIEMRGNTIYEGFRPKTLQ